MALPLPRGGLWRHRDFLLLWSAQGVSAVGSRITRTALPIAAIVTAGAGAIDLGFLTVALTLPGAVLAWVGGGIVDRRRRRPLMIGARSRARDRASRRFRSPQSSVTSRCRCCSQSPSSPESATMLYHLADHVFITDLVSSKRLLDANGKREAVDAVAEISGPAWAARSSRG